MPKSTKGTITVEIEVDSNGHKDAPHFLDIVKRKIRKIRCIGEVKLTSSALNHGRTQSQKDDLARELNDFKKVIRQGMPDIDYHMKGRKGSLRVHIYFPRPGRTINPKTLYDDAVFVATIRPKPESIMSIATTTPNRFNNDHELSMSDPKFFVKFKYTMNKIHKQYLDRYK
jgi:hypothetical protein